MHGSRTVQRQGMDDGFFRERERESSREHTDTLEASGLVTDDGCMGDKEKRGERERGDIAFWDDLGRRRAHLLKAASATVGSEPVSRQQTSQRPAAVSAANSQQRSADKEARYLVDPASSHMLVPKIKPCMCKYKPLYGETANGSLYQL